MVPQSEVVFQEVVMADTQINEAAMAIEEVAEVVAKIQSAAEIMMVSGLNRRAILLLLSDASGICMRDVDHVIQGMESLSERFLEDGEL